MRNWKSALAWTLAAFFVLGGLGNLLAPPPILEDYRRWGYPDWFHFVTGSLELASAGLLILRSTRLIGAGLAVLLMSAAAGTVLLHGEYAHALAPLAVLAVAVVVGWMTRRAGSGLQ